MMKIMVKQILRELRVHAPFTFAGALMGIAVMMIFQGASKDLSYKMFYLFHPMHVFLSALVTASVFRLHKCKRINGKCLRGGCNFWLLFLIGYLGSVGIATISDSLVPYLGEFLLDMPERSIHIGFIEKWWLVNPLAFAGIAIAYFKPGTRFPHMGHVLLSTWASLFHILMAAGSRISLLSYLVILVFLFFAVLIPCCVSDIVFPMFFALRIKREKNMLDWIKIDGEIFLASLGIGKGSVVLDFGCGGGNYVMPAARLAGKKGKVYAVDRNTNVLGRLKERIALEKLRNIEIIDTGGDVKLPIAEGSVDFVLLLDVLHSNYFEVESRKNLLGEICRVLNKNGLIILFPKHMENENFIEEIVKSGFIYKGKYLKTLLHDKNYEEGNIYIFQRAVSQE